MSLESSISAIGSLGWFRRPGAYVLVDGQYGSTGKGVAASLFALASEGRITHVTTNAGPNSGHTAWIEPGMVMTQQVPISSVVMYRTGFRALTYLNGGAIINPSILNREVETLIGGSHVLVHPTAALIEDAHVKEEAINPNILSVASTGKGVGAALAAKVMRRGNVAKSHPNGFLPGIGVGVVDWNWRRDVVFVETAQGFSLGINSERFYPFTTSRECTVMQALADARIPPYRLRSVCACYRTFPIRVGNTDHGQSGDCYPDQEETSWEAIGQPPEFTSVTRRMRRVFTWSRIQFRESIAVNEPDVIFLNFMNYLSVGEQRGFVSQALKDYSDVRGIHPALVLLGYGPKASDVQVW